MVSHRISPRIYVLLIVAALLGTGSWLVARYLTREVNRDMSYLPKPFVITPEVRLLQEYIRIDTSNPPGREAAGAQFLAAQLRMAGIEPQFIELAPGRTNLYARIRGREPGGGLLLLNHIDVVPAQPQGWRKPPFAGDILLDMLYGRGALDMKSIGIAQLRAFLDVAESKRQPLHDIAFLASADEEEASALGTGGLVSNRPDLFDGIRYAFGEGGITEMSHEDVIYYGIDIGSKQTVTARLVSKDRENLRRLRIALEPEMNAPDAEVILPQVVEYARRIAPHRTQGSEQMRDLLKTEEEGKIWLLPDALRVLTQNNLFVTGAESKDGAYEATLFLQNLPGVDPDQSVAKVQSLADRFGVRCEVIRKMGPSAISNYDTPLIRLAEREVRNEFGRGIDVGPLLLPYSSSDCRFLRARGIECYGLAPFPVDFFLTRSVHSIDERVKIDDFNRGVAVMRRLVSAYAFGG